MFSFLSSPVASAQDAPFIVRDVEARILEIVNEKEAIGGLRHYIFNAQEIADQAQYFVDTSGSHGMGVGYVLRAGDRVTLELVGNDEGETAYLGDVHREGGLGWVALMFAAIIVAVGLRRGVFSLLGLGVTAGVISFYLLPRILAGSDPVATTVIASAIILAINIPLSHGLRRQSLMALLASLAGLALIVVFTPLFISLARISGMASEEAALLFWELDGIQLPVGVLAAGIILATVGVLDDIAITQAEVVNELRQADPTASRRQLFIRAMRIGRHHIASTVNTLVLVYVGAALPVFLLSTKQAIGIMDFLNTELIAEEIVRTLAGTSALILTVPISTWLTCCPQRTVDGRKKQG